MKLGFRRWILLGLLAGLTCGLSEESLAQAQVAAQPKPGQLSEDQLGQALAALTLTPKKSAQRYDFAFGAKMDAEEWKLSMSAVLSQDGEWIWFMAWLDELPSSAADVPRTALLRLLAENDKLGNGKFFAYIPSNRRFVLQVAVPNQDMTSAKLKEVLQDLGTTVVETYPQWSVANWKQAAATEAAAAPTSQPAVPGPAAPAIR
jgi:hypothetical protein